MEEDKGTVCVTGGTGFIASWLIMRLLEQGYSVQTTVRPDPEKKRDLSYLTSLPRASEKLQIFTADLNDPDSFDAAIEGCTGVLHVATPMQWGEPEEVVTRRAINGTLGILRACLKSKTVKRVVYTSSVAAVAFNGKDVEVVIDESFWSDVDYIRKCFSSAACYFISKTSTERVALQFAEENGLDLVTVIPPFVVGPSISPKFPGSVGIASDMDERARLIRGTSMVHVDDVARAHIFLLEYPEAKGRYICSSHRITSQQISEYLSAKYPEYQIPTVGSLAENKGFEFPDLSSKKLLDTGFKFKYGFDDSDMLDIAIQYCKEKGYL